MSPRPGTATEADVIAEREGPDRRLCELVDGILVEKPMSTPESLLAIEVARLLGNRMARDDLGMVLGADGMLRLTPGLVRIPDVSFILWENIPGAEIELDQPIASLVPDLTVEVLSPSNTVAEMALKLKDYFFYGTRLVWVIDPRKQTAKVYTDPDIFKRVTKSGRLSAAPVLSEFEIALSDLFSRLSQRKRTG